MTRRKGFGEGGERQGTVETLKPRKQEHVIKFQLYTGDKGMETIEVPIKTVDDFVEARKELEKVKEKERFGWSAAVDYGGSSFDHVESGVAATIEEAVQAAKSAINKDKADYTERSRFSSSSEPEDIEWFAEVYDTKNLAETNKNHGGIALWEATFDGLKLKKIFENNNGFETWPLIQKPGAREAFKEAEAVEKIAKWFAYKRIQQNNKRDTQEDLNDAPGAHT